MIKDFNIQYLKGVGEKRAKQLEKLGIKTVKDLLEFYPRHYEDWSKCYCVSDAPIGENCCVKGYVSTKVSSVLIRKGLTLYKFTVTDGMANMNVTLFNQKYAAEKIYRGGEFLFFGKVTGTFFRKEMSSPSVEPVESDRIRPIYRATEGLNSKYIEKCVANALDIFGDDLNDSLPTSIRQSLELCHRRYALQNIHFPESAKACEIAKKRLVFEELLNLQLGLLMLKGHNSDTKTKPISNDYTDEFIKKFPFELTRAQKNAIALAVEDMKSEKPMSRLLQGDVGSGKTAVAATLLFNAAKNGFQSALMAPTEILAMQHYSSIVKLMNGTGVRVMLLTGSTPASEKKKVLELLKSGEIDVLIGTHALIQKGVEYKNLGLVITDEQHRFGVKQRSDLGEKGNNPHTFVMSATPIPRTLALVVYGDLDISVLDEMPKGRKPVETYSVSTELRKRAYTYVKKHLDKGQQGYIVCPMVDENEDFDLVSATKFYEKLQNGFFNDYKLGLLHGKMKPSEKDEVMHKFVSGEIDLLVATTVIEVGVDVPNANIMVVENAERFGLSQLHQLRGRVGRGGEQATCILISDAENDEAVRRLKIMSETTDGFKIADEDLKMRGPGDFFGSKQHGLPTLKIASIFDDRNVLKLTSKVAREILKQDPDLSSDKYKPLKENIKYLFENSLGYN